MPAWLSPDLDRLPTIAAATVLAYLVVILCTRVAGLRSFAKMSAFDFAMTIAVGSVLASMAVSSNIGLIDGVVALVTLFSTQALVAWLRRRTAIEKLVDNTPLLVMWEGEVIEAHLDRGRVTMADLRAKLREANVLRLADVRAVVLETTGDISVLHGGEPGSLEPSLLAGVAGVGDRLVGRQTPAQGS